MRLQSTAQVPIRPVADAPDDAPLDRVEIEPHFEFHLDFATPDNELVDSLQQLGTIGSTLGRFQAPKEIVTPLTVVGTFGTLAGGDSEHVALDSIKLFTGVSSIANMAGVPHAGTVASVGGTVASGIQAWVELSDGEWNRKDALAVVKFVGKAATALAALGLAKEVFSPVGEAFSTVSSVASQANTVWGDQPLA